MDIQHEETHYDPEMGNEEKVKTYQHIPEEDPEVENEVQVSRADAFVWYVVGILDALLALRLLFSLFGANDTGFASLIYGVTHPFIVPFAGIFPTPAAGVGYFDVAALLAMVVYYLIGWAIVALVDMAASRHTVHHI